MRVSVSGTVDLGLLRIPKNASSTLTSHPSFAFRKEFTPFAEFQGRVVAAVRDPEQRFLSSIPETIKRYRMIDRDRSLNRAGDVVVSREVHEWLSGLDLSKPLSVIEAFLEQLSSGFFDAHHQPQSHFLADESANALTSADLFDVKDIDAVLRALERDFGLPVTAQTPRANARERGQPRLDARSRLGLLKRRLQGVEPWRPEAWVAPHMDPAHPLSRYARSIQREFDCYGYQWVGYCLGNFYSSLRTAHADASPSLKERVRTIYANDIAIFDRVHRSGSTFLTIREGEKLY
jgi:hypothetical protein